MRSKVLKVFAGLCITFIVTAVSALLTLAITETVPVPAAEAVETKTSGAADLYNPQNLIRFHVIANSDSDRDQAMKRKVRDLIVERMTPEFAKAKNLEEARRIINEHLEEIKIIAQDEIKVWGADYPVKVQLGRFDFPVKTYGQLTLPAGNYEAVRVEIGQAQGANWWCVLFPPLCFVDVSKAMVPEEDNLKTDVLVDSSKEEFRIRFKILEIFDFLKEAGEKLIS